MTKPKRPSSRKHRTTKASTKVATETKLTPANTKKGIYTEYLDRGLDLNQLTIERKKQLQRISALRGGRAVLVYAADFRKGFAPISIDASDLIPINDQIAVLEGKKLDLILETGGGSGEAAEDIVRLLRQRFDEIGVVVPGTAKSAGTLIAMAGDEILMEQVSALGPIDAQIVYKEKQFSADALIQGLEDIKDHVTANGGVLNQAYIPILQNISPGEIRHAENVMEFAKILVREWLVKYKFKNWTISSSTGKPVTDEYRKARADKIAKSLSEHDRWKTHGRSIKIDDLRAMQLIITDYSENADLADAIRRYRILQDMTFAVSNIYKIIETPTSQILRMASQQTIQGVPPGMLPVGLPQPPQQQIPQDVDAGTLGVPCGSCGQEFHFYFGIGKETTPPRPGFEPFPKDNLIVCPRCGVQNNVSPVRNALESQVKKKIY